MGHPDFRVGGKIFATLDYPSAGWAMIKLPPDAQTAYVKGRPKAFTPVKGAWGVQGATNVELRHATQATVRSALRLAWEARAKKPPAR